MFAARHRSAGRFDEEAFVKTLFTAAAALMLLAVPAMAAHCPADMKAIDEALAKNPKLSDADMKSVKDWRAEGEKLHKDGKHKESVETLDKAKKKLGI
jgi:hypothetical protein